MKNVLIYGGFNWLGYELTQYIIKYNVATNIIIVDNMKHHLTKDLIKEKFDNYAHLYNENLFLYTFDIGDTSRLTEIYQRHKIHVVINNIKYNIYDNDVDKSTILDGYKSIQTIHKIFGVSNYAYISRMYTHNKALLNNKCRNIVEDNLIHNEKIRKITQNEGIEIIIPDYLFGTLKDKHNNIVVKLDNIFRSGSPFNIPNESFFCLYDEDLVEHVIRVTLQRDNDAMLEEMVYGPHSYKQLVKYMAPSYKMSSNVIMRDKDKSESEEIVTAPLSEIFKDYISSLS